MSFAQNLKDPKEIDIISGNLHQQTSKQTDAYRSRSPTTKNEAHHSRLRFASAFIAQPRAASLRKEARSFVWLSVEG